VRNLSNAVSVRGTFWFTTKILARQSRNRNSEYLAQRRKTRSLDEVKRNPGNPPRIPLSFHPRYMLEIHRVDPSLPLFSKMVQASRPRPKKSVVMPAKAASSEDPVGWKRRNLDSRLRGNDTKETFAWYWRCFRDFIARLALIQPAKSF
jgi:hypothetical protein